MLANRTVASSASAVRAADGTSTIAPARSSPWARARSTNHAASAASATIGAITQTSAPLPAAAAAMAVSCVSSTSGWACSARSPRSPSAGLGSRRSKAGGEADGEPAGDRNGSGLSAPASSTRTVTLRPAYPEKIFR